MPTTLHVCGVALTPDALPGAITLAADGAPRRGIQALELDPGAWFSELWDQLRGDATLRAIVADTLSALLSSPSPARRGFVVRAFDLVPDAAHDAALPALTALLDDAALEPDAQRALARVCARLVLAQRLPLDETIQRAALRPVSGGELLGACWIGAHTWTLAHLSALLPEEPADAAFVITTSLYALRRSEWEDACDALELARDALGKARHDAIMARMRRVEASVDWSAPERAGEPRWRRDRIA
jgi:hypothetical protein